MTNTWADGPFNPSQKLHEGAALTWTPGNIVHHPKHGGGIVRQFVDGKVPQIVADFDSLTVPGKGQAPGSPGRIFFPASLALNKPQPKVPFYVAPSDFKPL